MWLTHNHSLHLASQPQDRSLFHEALKRGFDILGAGVGLAILWPAGLLIGLLIKLSDGGPVFFKQIRVGRFGKPFNIWKFRTMVRDAEQQGLPLTGGADGRVTHLGRFLRRTKVDELPQLWNVLIGEMSLVGPRPEVPRYVEHYTTRQREILQFKPGITDLASVLFRNEEALLRGSENLEQFYLSHCLPKKIELNRQYAKRAGVLQDVWIILQTLCPYWLGMAVIYAVALVASLWLSYQLRYDFQMTQLEYAQFWRCMPWIVLSQLVALGAWGQLRCLMSYFSLPELNRSAVALTMTLVFFLVLRSLTQDIPIPTATILLINGCLSWSALCAIRMGCRYLREHRKTNIGRRGTLPRRVAIIGAGEMATRMASELSANCNDFRRVVAFFDDDPRRWHKRPFNIPIVGMPECLMNPEWQTKIDDVVVILPEIRPIRRKEISALLQRLPLKVTFIPA